MVKSGLHSSVVFFLPWHKVQCLEKLIEKIDIGRFVRRGDFVAVKLHFGEKGNEGYIKPQFVSAFVRAVKKLGGAPFLTDTNTIYRGSRSNALVHLMTAAGHGFKLEKVGAPILIADGLHGSDYVEVGIGGRHFERVKIASAVYSADVLVCLSHVKGHILSGFGGALKNLGMGCAARPGKYEMHSSATPLVDKDRCVGCGACIRYCPGSALSVVDGKVYLDSNKCVGCGDCIHHCPNKVFDIDWGEKAAVVCERFVEYARGAVVDKRAVYFNFLNHFTKDCDCFGKKQDVLLPDIGVLASSDPVAIDQASYDLICKAAGEDIIRRLHSGAESLHQVIYAQELGLGTRRYQLVEI